ncbi:MAG: Gfo/Idh/MocA family protein [Granulosicoccus sp.]
MALKRGALIGCGFFSVNHLQAWRDIEGVEIVALCDVDAGRLKLLGDQFAIADRYTDADALFAAGGFDFVDVATTVDSHLELVMLAAEHKVPVICQKPFAKDLKTAGMMVNAAEEAGIPLMVHENFRWQVPIQAVKRTLDSGEIGTPFWGRFSFRSGYDVFANQPYLAEGERFIIEDLGIHVLDIARYLMGDVLSATARTSRINPSIAGEDVATVLLDHVTGYSSVVDCSYASKLENDPFPQTLIEIDGSLGTIRLSNDYQVMVSTQAHGHIQSRQEDVAPPLLSWAEKPWHGIQHSVFAIQSHWIDCLENTLEPATSGEDNLKTLALVEAAYQSASTGKLINTEKLLAECD